MSDHELKNAWYAALVNQPCEKCGKEILAPYELCLECQKEIDLAEEAEINRKYDMLAEESQREWRKGELEAERNENESNHRN